MRRYAGLFGGARNTSNIGCYLASAGRCLVDGLHDLACRRSLLLYRR